MWLLTCRWPKHLKLAQLNKYNRNTWNLCVLRCGIVSTPYPYSMPLVSASLLPSEPLAVVVQAVEEVPATMLSLTPDRLEGFVSIEASGAVGCNPFTMAISRPSSSATAAPQSLKARK